MKNIFIRIVSISGKNATTILKNAYNSLVLALNNLAKNKVQIAMISINFQEMTWLVDNLSPKKNQLEKHLKEVQKKLKKTNGINLEINDLAIMTLIINGIKSGNLNQYLNQTLKELNEQINKDLSFFDKRKKYQLSLDDNATENDQVWEIKQLN